MLAFRAVSFARLLAAGLVSLCAGCVGSPAPKPAAPAPAPRPPAVTTPEAVVDPQLEAELRADVKHLAQTIGERNTDKKWELASAADYLVDRLEALGYAVSRHGYEVGDAVVQNLEVSLPAGDRGDEVLIVGAHYDSAPGTPGADDNASGVAALLALARRLQGKPLSRSVRLVFFANEEPPHFQTETMGSLVYARQLAQRGGRVVGMLSLESLGVYSDAPGSQRYPAALAARFPTVGNFVAVVADESSRELGERVATHLRRHGSVPVEHAALPRQLDGVGWSDHWSFWQVGVPAVMVTDTAPFRYEHYHAATDTPERLDYARLGRVVLALRETILRLANDAVD